MRIGRGVLARLGEEPAASAGLRYGVADPGRAQGVPAAARGGGTPRPPQARRRAGPVLASPTRSAPGLAVFHPKGGIIRRELENYSRAPRTRRPATPFVDTPHITKGQLFETSGPPAVLRGHDVPAHAAGGRGVLPQADELPVPQPDLPGARDGRTGSCRCACSSSARCTGTRSPAWCTASPACAA